MSKREYAAKRLNEFMHQLGHVSAEQMIDFIIDAVREEEDSRKVDRGPTTKEPQLIQGYTAEQWQEIIDGGYLCEFKNTHEEGWHLDTLRVFESDSIEPFESSNFSDWVNCRPAQIKGVMRPIFVEPVDKSSMLCLFERGGFPLNNRMSRPSWDGYRDGSGDFYAGATKYIEL